MSETVIQVEALSKQYRLGAISGGRLADDLNRVWARLRRQDDPLAEVGRSGKPKSEGDPDTLWALRDVSFQVNKGEVVGIIGRNGAGKSTLLKILSRVTTPTTGEVRVRGRIASLLEVGTGFHPELSGRENIFLNAAILGMSRAEVQRKFDEIVEFSGVQKFIDTPVKRYSSGMYVRLAFAVAAHLEPEILIVDEVLAVGDAEFQAKCLGKMHDVAIAGRTILFVSHNMGAVRTLCTRGIVFRQGKLAFDGPADAAIDDYTSYLQKNAGVSLADPERSGNGKARLIACQMLDENNKPTTSVIAGTTVALEFKYKAFESLRSLDFVVTLFDSKGMAVTNLSTSHTGESFSYPPREGTVRCTIPKLPLLPGQYRVAVALTAEHGNYDLIPSVINLEVSSSIFFPAGRVPDPRFCACMVEHRWIQHSPS